MNKILSADEVIYDFDASQYRGDLEGEFILPQYEEVYKRINTALSLKNDGYNLYLVDEFCKGRIKHILNYVKSVLKNKAPAQDICYVIKEDDKVPVPLFVKNGYGNVLKNKIEKLKANYEESTFKFYNNLENKEKEELVSSIKDRRSKIIEDLINKSKEFGFDIKMGEDGFTFVPIVEGKAMTEDEFDDLSEVERNEIIDKVSELRNNTHEILEKLRTMKYDELSRIKEIMSEFLKDEIKEIYEEINNELGDDIFIMEYINYIMKEIEDKLIENYSINYDDDEEEIKAIIYKYDINVIVDNSKLNYPPVIYEEDPSVSNLFGNIDYENHNNVYVSTVKSIKAGSYVRANGGCLIINASSFFSYSQSYYYLKKAILSEKVDLDYNRGYIELFTLGGLKPASMPINTKVILIGDYTTYDTLYNYDNEFKTMFKLRAEYKGILESKNYVNNLLVREIEQIIKENNLNSITFSGVREISKYLARKAEDRYKILFDHEEISNLLLLGDCKAIEKNLNQIDEKVIQEVAYSKEEIEKEYLNLYEENKMMLKVKGSKIGQINGLSVIDIGYVSFGKPIKITCTCFYGDGRIMDSQRESNLSGNIHTKAMNILKGYMSILNDGYTKLPVDFNISFEQIYGMIDGDSASVAEALCMISSLCKIPIKQNIAITGSINQFGEVQPIGGVNEKIEGFFNVCKTIDTIKGKGVVIPQENARNLVLSDEVEKAIDKGLFVIYTMETVEDAMKIIFDMEGIEERNIADIINEQCKLYIDKNKERDSN